MAPFLLWWEFGFDVPNFEPPPANQKDGQKYLKQVEEQTNEQLKSLESRMRLLSLFQIGGALLQGVSLVSVPLLLRAFCRALRLSESEANCDGLLKIGGALLAVGLVIRSLWGWFFLSLMMLVGKYGTSGGLAALLNLAWTVLYLVVLVQISRAIR